MLWTISSIGKPSGEETYTLKPFFVLLFYLPQRVINLFTLCCVSFRPLLTRYRVFTLGLATRRTYTRLAIYASTGSKSNLWCLHSYLSGFVALFRISLYAACVVKRRLSTQLV